MRNIILFAAGILSMLACNHVHNNHLHDHSQDLVSHTVWTDRLELFVEFPPLVAGELSSFTSHFTLVDGYKPIEDGELTLSLVKGTKGIRSSVKAPSSKGVFKPGLNPKEPGVYQLIFDLESSGLSERIVIEGVEVYANSAEASKFHPNHGQGDEISFSKEQAWNTNFSVASVQKRDMHHIIATSGKIEPMLGDESLVVAKTDGIVLFNDKAIEGGELLKGEAIFTLSGEGIAEENVQTRFSDVKAVYQKSQIDYNRAQKLLKESLISQKDFDEIQLNYTRSKTAYESVVSSYEDGGQKIESPFAGFVKDVLVREGQFVKSGEALAVLTKNKKLVVRADLSQKYFSELTNIVAANFKTAYGDEIYNTELLNGRVLSYAKSVGEKSNYLPIYFEIDNKGKLLSGSYVEIFLKTKPLRNVISIPRKALMEDYENYYVFVQTAGEIFEKVPVELGVNDGDYVQILSGLSLGDRLVEEGAFQLKMASVSSSIPAHGHAH